MTDAFIMKFSTRMDWGLLSAHYDFSIDMLRIYMHRVKWASILRRKRFSEDFLREVSPNFTRHDWNVISQHYTLSEAFMREFAHKLNWETIALYQNVSGSFLDEHNQYFEDASWRVL